MAKHQRRFANFFISPREQAIFGVRMMLVPLGLLLLLGFTFFAKLSIELQRLSHQLPDAIQGEYTRVSGDLVVWGMIGLFFGALYILLYTMLVSHRVFGPMVSLRAYVKQLMEGGAPGPLKLREDDYFHDLALLLTQLNEKTAGAQVQKKASS